MGKFLLIGGSIVLICGAGALTLFTRTPASLNTPQGLSTLTFEPLAPAAPVPRDIPAGYKEYASKEHFFSLLYPDTLMARGFREKSGAVTILFENTSNPESLRGFQIFIASYTGTLVTESVVKSAMPGAHTFEKVVIDGAPGLAFFAPTQLLGETREVWFAQKGLLYQVSTPRSLEADLLPVLETWKFLR